MIPQAALVLTTNIIRNLRRAVGVAELISLGTALLSVFSYDTFNSEAFVKDTTVFLPEYDFIVVGSGSAGAVVAARLSEVPSWKVLLLEAGGNENELVEIPALFAYFVASDADWRGTMVPSEDGKYCQAMNNKQCSMSRGKILGGTSSINAMVYVRGNRHDFDNWERMGNPGWSYEDVLPYFRKSEDNRNREYVRSGYHGAGGPLTVQESPYNTPLANYFMQAGKDFGYDIHDINGANQTGFMISQGTMRKGARLSTERAFLRPARARKNLHVSMNSQVTKVLIDPFTKNAYGVEFFKGGLKYVVRAKKEVVLSAGAVGSPHLLMLSGVGVKENLEEHRIPVIQDLKVGSNLQDHYGMGGVTFTINASINIDAEKYIEAQNIVEYVTKRTGVLSSIAAECVAFLKTKYADESKDWPDIQFEYTPVTLNADKKHLLKISNLREDFFDALYGPLGDRKGFMIVPNIMRPYSTGHIRLRSADPFQHPAVVPNYFKDPRDMDILIAGLRLAIALTQTPTFQKINATFYDVPIPGCEHLEFASDEYFICGFRQFTFSIWHFAGSCKMGPRSDADAVVDHRLRVHGVGRLRVMDASIMPVITTGNLNAPIIMIGEKGADLIKEDWRNILPDK